MVWLTGVVIALGESARIVPLFDLQESKSLVFCIQVYICVYVSLVCHFILVKIFD